MKSFLKTNGWLLVAVLIVAVIAGLIVSHLVKYQSADGSVVLNGTIKKPQSPVKLKVA